MSLLLAPHWVPPVAGDELEFPAFSGMTVGLKTARVTFKPNGEIWNRIDTQPEVLGGFWRTGGGAGAAYSINGLVMNINRTWSAPFRDSIELEFTIRRVSTGAIVGGGTWNLAAG